MSDSAAQLLPSECPNCGRMHPGHDFEADPGPVQRQLAEIQSAPFAVFWKGEQHVVHGRDREHAKRILYMTIPEAKWNEIK